MSPKWPILWRLACKTLPQPQSISQPTIHMTKLTLKPVKQSPKLGLYLLINVDRIVSRQCEFIYGDVVMLTVISFSDHSCSTANTILSCSNLIYKRTQNKYKCVQLPSTYVCWQNGTTAFARCTPLLQQSIENLKSPTPDPQYQTCCSGSAAVGPCWDRQTNGQTDKWTLYCSILAAPQSTYYAGSANKVYKPQKERM